MANLSLSHRPLLSSAAEHTPSLLSLRRHQIWSALGAVLVCFGMAQTFRGQSLQMVPTIATDAGTGTAGFSGNGGLATSAELTNPLATVHDADGNMYIADYNNNRVRKVAYGTGIITTIAGNGTGGFSGDGGQATAAELHQPGGLALDSTNTHLYIGDIANNRVRVINLTTGVITTFAGTGSAGFSGDGGQATAAQFNYTDGLKIDKSGNLFICDKSNFRVRKVVISTGVVTTVVGNGTAGYTGDNGLAILAEINQVYDIGLDASGNLYFVDSINERVRTINVSTGIITTVAGNGTAGFTGDGGAATSAELNVQHGTLAIDAAGNILLNDQNNERVRMITAATGTIDTIAGTGATGYSGNGGPATSASFNHPERIEFNLGTIYISDISNNVIRTLTMNPNLFSATQVGSTITRNILFEVMGAATSITSFSFGQSEGGVGEFSVGTVTGCVVNGSTTNAVGTICTVPVTFTPAYPGVRDEPMIVKTNGGTQNFGMAGTGLAPEVAVSPGAISTVAGTGTAGSTGNGAAATAATLSGPARSVVDYQGNIFIADTANNEIREVVASTGKIVVVAGNSTACSAPTAVCGDGAAATSANLKGPRSVAVDAAGNLFIADTGDNRIRRIDAISGNITTVAGTGTASYTGDGGQATAATLQSPEDIAVDASGNLYVADTDNNAIREVNAASDVISTVAGTGAACATSTAACGDSGAATSAQLKLPEGIALSPTGLVIADTGDNRIRSVNTSTGVIITAAGTGAAGYIGDGAAATGGELQAPAGVTTDSAGDLYIADSSNNVIRMVSEASGIISTIDGTGTACNPSTAACGDGGNSAAAKLAAPMGITIDGLGNLYIADTGDNRIREVNASNLTLNFASTAVGTTSTDSPQTVTVENIGNESLTLSVPSSGTNPMIATGFNLANASTCPQLTSSSSAATLPAGEDCTYAVDFAPVTAGTFTGTLAATDNALNNPSSVQAMNLHGVATMGATTTTLTSSQNPSSLAQSVTFTATVGGLGTEPTGTVSFYNGATLLGTGTVNASGVATFTTTTLPVGSDSITAAYGGDTNYNASTSAALTQTVNKASGADTLTTSNASPTFSQSITLTDTIPIVGGIAPTGTVTFYNGSTAIGTGTVNASGIATLATGSLPAGTDSVTAVYGGDANYGQVTSNAVTETVAKNTGADTLITSNASPTFGQSITLTDTIPTVGGVAPTGTVTFYNGSTAIGTGTVNASGVAMLATGVLPVGTDSVTAIYGGDTNYGQVTSNAVTETVGKGAGADTLMTTNAAPTFGQSITLTDTIPTINGVAPTGTVTFYNGSTAIGTGTVNASGVATLATGILPVGTDSVTAVYGGDANYAQVTSNAVTETVGKAAGADTLTTTNAAPTFGQSITLTDTIPTINGVAPTGTVTFYNGSTAIGTGTVNASGVAMLATGVLPVGTDSVTAVYSGDANYAQVTSNAVTETVGKAAGADNLATSNASPAFGQSITLTDTIPTVNGVVPTGTVTFYNGSTAIGTGTVNASGVATLTTGTLPVGSDSITAIYGGDGNYAQVTSNALTETVGKAAGTDTLTTSNASPNFGQAITLTDTIPTVNGVAPTGTVTFYNGSTAIGTGTVNASGIATLTTGTLPVGSDSVTAVYGGDANYSSVTAGPLTETVGKSSSADTLSTSNASPTYGQSITLTDTVPTVGGVAPTGTVIFYDGAAAVGTGTLNASGVATLSTGSLPTGADSVTAVYGGDANYSQVTSNEVTVTVGKAAGADTLTTSNASPNFGQSITLTDTIPTVNGVAPTGTVTFYNGTTVIGTGTVNASGVATLATGSLPAGTDSLTAVYGGDGNYAQVTAGPLTEAVGKSTGTDTLTTSNASPSYSQSITLTDTLPTVGGIAPTGTVTFYNGATAIGTGTVNASGVATLMTAALPVGTDSVTATYGGDSNYASATAGPVAETVGKANGADALTTSDASPALGEMITLTDTIPEVNGVAPTGTVTFYDGGTVIGTGTVGPSGVATFVATVSTSTLPVGSDSITAVYSGDTTYASVTAGPIVTNVSKSTQLDTLATSNANISLGQSVTFTDTVPIPNNSSGPTGTVTFYWDTTAIGTAMLNASGVATLTTTMLPAGSGSITGVYPGDANYQSSNAGPLTETVTKGAAADSLTSSNSAPTVGQSVTLTDTIPVVAGIAPTGTVTFYNGSTAIGTGTVSASGIATLATGALPVGSDSITAVYSGDSNYASATAGPLVETVAKAAGSDTLNASNTSPTVGQSVTFTDTLPTVNGIVPTGMATFYNGSTAIGTGTVNASGVATLTTGSLPAGSDSITAVYGGDANFSPATAGPLVETVSKASGSDALMSSNQSPIVGQSVTFTDTLTMVNSIPPTGSVTFYSGATAIGTGTVNASGVATLITGSLPVGSDSVTAVYGGDGNYSSATAGPIVETVSRAAGSDTLTSSNTSPTVGQSVTFTDTLPTVNGVVPTGTVTFYDGTAAIGTGTVNAAGMATLTTGALPVGSDSITAVYGGDSNYTSATAGPLVETVAKASASDTLTSSNSNPMAGQSVTFTDTLPLMNGVVPTGTVTFYDGTTVIGTGTVNASGAATLITGALPVGTDSITAVYGGDSNYNSSTAGPVAETVTKDTGTDVLTSSNLTTVVGQAVTFTDTLPIVNGIVPTGTVTFYSGTTVIGTGSVNASGLATLTTGSLPVGSDSITAVYSGDANYGTGTGSPLAETVAKAASNSVLTTSNPAPAQGTPVTFTDTIGTVNGVTPTGTVTFYDGTTVIGTGTINASGVATLITSALPTGTDTITANYAGDSNFTPGVSNAVNETVKPVISMTLSSSNMAPSVGEPVTFSDTITPMNGIAPTGTVTFYDGTMVIGTGTVNASGVATITTGSLPAGTDVITAVYSGDSNYPPSTTGPVIEVVSAPVLVHTVETITASIAATTVGESVTFTSTINIAGGVAPTGIVTFYDGTTIIGTGMLNASGVAALTTGSLPVGANSITASYAGDANYQGSEAGPVTVTVSVAVRADFTIAATPDDPTINPGDTVSYTVSLSGLNSPFDSTVTLSATGQPPGATVSFTPDSLIPGAGPTTTRMAIQTSSTQARLWPLGGFPKISYGLLLLPFLGVRRFRRKLQALPKAIIFGLAVVALLAALGGMTGCGGGYFGLPPHQYTITVTGSSGPLHHSTTVMLTVR